jgi:hypothetical protein
MVNLEVRKKLMDAEVKYYNEKNLDLFCGCFHPEIETSILGSDHKKKGIEDFRARFKILFESSPNLHCEIKNRIFLEESVVDEEFVTGSSSYPDGKHAVLIFGFKDDLISSICAVR